ncbi:MAG: DNA adenine methylase [Treponema sp.]|jgi:DNA adenine methylase|nr:DNA adenine methylase [Treponema sp.]
MNRTERDKPGPFVKWAGGKRQLLPEIRKLLPPDLSSRIYFEPFVGAGALLFDLEPHKAVINDSNKELMLAYRAIRDNVEELIAALKVHRELYSKEYYYEVRSQDREKNYDLKPDVEKAARLIFLNKTCYNGLFRVNSKGYFNVPMGRHKSLNICEEALLRAVSRYLNSADLTILNTDFEEAVTTADSNSFVYFDPPYHSSAKNAFSEYQAGGFGENEQIRLRNVFLTLTERRVPCLLSNADTPFIRDLYQNKAFRILTVSARRSINSDQQGRGKVNEVLITSY